MQLITAKNTETTEDDYLAVIDAKTAALFAAAAEVGAVIAERPKSEAAALRSYGRNLGLAFQLVDDALDYSGEQSTLGKSVGDDFREGKITLPVVLCYRRGNDEEREFWQRTLKEGEIGDDDLAEADRFDRPSTMPSADTMERARHYGAIARDALAIFPDCDVKSALLEAIEFCCRPAVLATSGPQAVRVFRGSPRIPAVIHQSGAFSAARSRPQRLARRGEQQQSRSAPLPDSRASRTPFSACSAASTSRSRARAGAARPFEIVAAGRWHRRSAPRNRHAKSRVLRRLARRGAPRRSAPSAP